MTIKIKKSPNYVEGSNRIIAKGNSGEIKTRFSIPTVPIDVPMQYNEYLLNWYRGDSIVTDGSYITQLLDKSGNNRHLGQGNGNSYCPTLETNTGNVFGNHATWRFSGYPQYMTGSVWNLDGASDVGYTIFHVFASRTSNTNLGVWDLSQNTSTNNYGLAALGADGASGTGIVRTGTWPTLTYTRPADDTPFVFTVNWRTGSSGLSCQAWINGTSAAGPTTLVGGSGDNPVNLRLGSLWQDVWWFDSSQAEFLMCSGTLPSSAREAIESYLMSRYSII